MTNSQGITKKRQPIPSISQSISVSLGLQEPSQSSYPMTDNFPSPNNNNNTYSQSEYFGRSYVGGLLPNSPAPRKHGRYDLGENSLPVSNTGLHNRQIHQAQRLHRQTAEISKGLNDSYNDDNQINEYIDLVETNERRTAKIDDEDIIDTYIENNLDAGSKLTSTDQTSNIYLTPTSSAVSRVDSLREYDGNEFSDRTQLLPVESFRSYGTQSQYNSIENEPEATTEEEHHSLVENVFSFTYNVINQLPACTLGLLLTILDALSYGMIIFPITEPLFAQMGPSGISMFYISTIICQTVLSGGWSSFPNSIGSEMIEITPFFHTMALAIMNSLGEDRPDEVITTTIFCYVISAMITGVTFLLLGKLKLGKIVGFFPRHILIGCIGGVGYFLIITGLEVCTRASKFEYSIPFLSHLFTDAGTLWKWLTPVLLTVTLVVTQNYFQNSLVLPSFYILTLLLFHFIVALIPSLSLDKLRHSGWIFPMAAADSQWYDHYRYFNIHNAHWGLIFKQLPTMLALTFFGILHVPINVPALAMSLQMDKYDVDRELIAHGWSNLISGMAGSIQNYLVYTNSLLFIRAGADSALSGYILIVLTIIVMLIGPVIISLIPICIVGSLIFLLGYELLIEALWDTWGKLTKFEYITVVIIVLTMGIFDFVLGIIIGILIACFKFLVDTSKLQTINGEFNGTVAKSTVYRDSVQTKFLNGIGEQIYILKLQNLLFFGTIISIEEKVDKLLEISDKDSSKRRIKYLILDFKNINADNIDYSAAEGFNRIKRFTQTKNIQLIISSIRERDHIYNVFNNVGLLDDVELFNDLNSALEWCENEFLFQYKELREKVKRKLEKMSNNTTKLSAIRFPTDNQPVIYINGGNTDINATNSDTRNNLLSMPINTPRNHQVLSVAQNVYKSDEQTTKSLRNQLQNEDPVVPLLLLALKSYRPNIISTDKDIRKREIELWSKLSVYMNKTILESGSILQHSNNIFFVVETGILKALFHLPQGTVYETMSNRTCYGKMVEFTPDLSDTKQLENPSLTIKTETESVLWIIDNSSLQRMRQEDPDLYIELTLLIMSIKDKRFKDLLGHALISS